MSRSAACRHFIRDNNTRPMKIRRRVAPEVGWRRSARHASCFKPRHAHCWMEHLRAPCQRPAAGARFSAGQDARRSRRDGTPYPRRNLSPHPEGITASSRLAEALRCHRITIKSTLLPGRGASILAIRRMRETEQAVRYEDAGNFGSFAAIFVKRSSAVCNSSASSVARI